MIHQFDSLINQGISINIFSTEKMIQILSLVYGVDYTFLELHQFYILFEEM